MIYTDEKIMRFKGTPEEVLADLAQVNREIYKKLRKEYSEEISKRLITDACRYAFMTIEELFDELMEQERAKNA